MKLNEYIELQKKKIDEFQNFWEKEQTIYGTVNFPDELEFSEWDDQFTTFSGLNKISVNE